MGFYKKELLQLLDEFNSLKIAEQIDYKKFYLYSIITHSTAIEGSTVTEIENQLLFDEGINATKRTMIEQLMNLDLKAAYEKSFEYAKNKTSVTVENLKVLSSLVMRNTGSVFNSISGTFDSRKGELRLVNVSAGMGGKSYMSFTKVPDKLESFCTWLNNERKNLGKDIYEDYKLSFLAHYNLVLIHPWVDGNGRMSRLLMNQIQSEADLLPSIVFSNHKDEYIASLSSSQEEENPEKFLEFMFSELIEYLKTTISNYKKSIKADSLSFEIKNDPINDPINALLDLIKTDASLNYAEYAEKLGKSEATVKRLIQKLKNEGKIERSGSNKTGFWKIVN